MLSLEYIAGFIDGEGGFSTRASGSSPYAPSLHVGNTNEKVIQMVAESIREYTGCDRGLSVSRQEWFKHNRGHRDSYRLWVGGKPLAKLIPMIIPHLIVKREQAEMVRGLIDLIAEHGHNGVGLSDEELGLRKDMADYIKLLNQGIL